MALPNVNITILNGQLGQITPTDDGVAGVVMTGVATANIALGETKLITSVADAEALLLTAAYDVTNTTNVYKTIKDFYSLAGTGAELYIMILAKTNLMAAICDNANDLLKKLLNDANGRIRIGAVTRVPDGAYVEAQTGQVDTDVINSFPKAQQLADAFAAVSRPVRILLDGRNFQGNVTTLQDLRGYTYNRVAGVLFTDVASSKNASVGLVLGRLAAIAVQRNIGRVKDGDIGVSNASLTNQSVLIETLGTQDMIHDKNWIAVRKFPNKNGYFFNNDFAAAGNSDDYNHIARGRVIDKAAIITYNTYVEEILDDIDIDDDGLIAAGVIKDYQAKIQRALDEQMVSAGNITRATCVIDPKQNILSTNQLNIDLSLRPKGLNQDINVRIGFSNPANA